jgi:hypothetical protein
MQTHFFRCIDCSTIVPVQADVWMEGVIGDIVTSTGKVIHYDDPTIKKRCCTTCLQARIGKLLKDQKPIGEFYGKSQINQDEDHSSK